jgi:hypothetical protein
LVRLGGWLPKKQSLSLPGLHRESQFIFKAINSAEYGVAEWRTVSCLEKGRRPVMRSKPNLYEVRKFDIVVMESILGYC